MGWPRLGRNGWRALAEVEFDKPSTAQQEIERLALWIVANCPEEVGAGNPQDGESAVDVAIRLLERQKVS